ncbi:MAG: bi-domain-containing oxidoreductase [Nitrospiraceae bacterium]|nr:bi-domain-containing oxidoreductase [Nitrospiraceae bacterium]
MKQILQNLKTGVTELTEVPCPSVRSGHLLIRTSRTLVSAGTERMLVEFGKANLLDKARQQPDKVRMVLDKIKTDGLMPTIDTVRNKLDQPLPMGYCNAGTVIGMGAGVSGFAIGGRVASNGKHAEVVCVPKNLCAKIPGNVSDEAAAFTVIGAIALQGVRLAQPALGESVVVTGLGLIGLMAVQLLRANGCRVLGIDFDSSKCALAREMGAEAVDLSRGEDPVAAGMAFSRGRGVDAVLITASTKSNEPVHQAALMSRKRGRIVLVGVVGLELSRADFYEKELSFQVSCSYGAGRYDPLYEEGGQDYPFGLVRWTEQRNFEAVLDMLSDGRLNTGPLISHRLPMDRAVEAYAQVSSGSALGILLEYEAADRKQETELRKRTIYLSCGHLENRGAQTNAPADPVIGFIGSGNYATSVLIPAFKQTKAVMKTVVSSMGVSGIHAARKYGFSGASTDSGAALEDPAINAIVVATRHDSHARYVCGALKAGKHVFVEKPLCLTREELSEIEDTAAVKNKNMPARLIMVGFNRRFAPHVKKMKELLADHLREPKSFVMTVNAGAIPPGHWTQDRAAGGGRIIGEACHFIDLLRFLADSPVVAVQAAMIGPSPAIAVRDDKVTFTMTFADGSLGTVHYMANGHKSFPKESLEVFCDGRVLQMDNFRKLRGFGWTGFSKMDLWRQDKGQRACAAAFIQALRTGLPSPIAFSEIVEVTRIGFDIMDILGS